MQMICMVIYREYVAFMLKFLIAVLSLSLSACMVGPNFREPAKPVVEHWKKNKSVKETPAKEALWWNVFHDPVLSQLINQGYQNNLSLQSAGVKVLQARAQLAQTVGQLYPQQQAMTGNYSYNRLGGSSLQSVLPQTFDTAQLGFVVNWEIDFWGKYRRAILSNDAAFLSSVAAYDNALVTLNADIARTYVKIRTIQQQIIVVNTNIQVQAEGLRIARSRYNAGQTSLVDVEQASTELSETQSTLPGLNASLQIQKDALSVLLGEVPNKLDRFLLKNKGIPKAPSQVAVGIPKEALVRRPDIHQARLTAIAQSEAIGAAKAALFPSFSLAGSFSFAANTINGESLSDLFNWSNRTITAGPGLNWPLLNYGQITNTVRVQDAAFQQAVLNYVNLVLKAQQEVQDNITNYIEAKNAVYYLTKANASATRSLKLALIRYREGETDFTPVLDSEQQLLKVQTSLINAQGDVPQSLVALYRSLGGGWQIRKGNDVVAKQIKAQMASRTNWGKLLQPANHLPPTSKGKQIKDLYLPKW